ncbi:hypothetical protein J7F03_37315 [Streptomyces sp. ISL-43]|uniref:three-helix bundle dimerization domain-containing protein n=1 Tax=Streptomyces sp. ISL-43 TaxID=2819183 RepID=UPI001BE78C84|nr:hypothetical protein [Streptomyces sp. ISL-43]MBT2452605.1 hypothetical protein [Streptomyces sp. ISL-43]
MSSPPTPAAVPDQRLFATVGRLAARHEGRFSPETVQRLLADSYTRLAATAHVRTHLVVLAERLATERLDALAKTQSPPDGGRPRVLFVCLDWPVADPDGAPIAVVRAIRDEIDAHITALLADLS